MAVTPVHIDRAVRAEDLEQYVMLTTLEKAVAWAQTKSMWPDTFGLACCAIEMMSIASPRYDIARFGMEAFRSSPRQADLLIVSGRVSHKMAAPLRQIYDQMLEPKWVIAMGACASSGGMFNNYAILQSVDKIVPVDVYVPGCPPRPEQLMEGIIRLHQADPRGHPAGLRAGEVAGVTAAQLAAAVRKAVPKSVVGHETGIDMPALTLKPEHLVAVGTYLRDEQGFNFLSDIAATDYLGYGEPASPATSAPPRGRDLNAPDEPGRSSHPPAAKPKRFAVSYHLAHVGEAPGARVRLQVWLDDGEPVPSVVPVWPTADWHEREAVDLMGIAFDGPPEPAPAILTDDDWEGHPLRKDYPIGGEPVRFSEDE